MFTPPARTIFNLIPNDIGRPLSDITNKLSYDDIITDAEVVLDKLQTVEREIGAIDGRIFLMRVLPYRTEEDRINGVVLTFIDMTEHKKAEIVLRENEAWLDGQKEAFQAAMNGQPLAESLSALGRTVVTQTGGDARFAFYMTPAGQEGLHHIVGMSDAYALKINGFKIGPESMACGLAMHTGEPVITPDIELEPRWELWKSVAKEFNYRGCWSFPVRTTGGPIVGTFAVYFNEPREPKPRELELAGIVAYAAAIIISRHTELTERAQAEAALRQSEQQLKNLLRIRDEFIGIASHELKTPITSMKAYAEIIRENIAQSGHSKDVDLLTRLNAQIDRLTTLVNTLLDTTRISEGQLKLTPETFDINKLLVERTEEIKRTSHHQFEIQTQPLPMVYADAERIGQVITNLLSNAVKYSPDDTTITVKTEKENDYIKVSIADKGYGISEEEQEKIFDRFYRITSDNFDTFPGMGLGLYISAQIIHRHQGTINVKSKPGDGATFSFTIPVSKQ
ncbi:PAS domain-containing protein [Chitinophaga pendula]|uniref:sensor histidine kinase n=1 Tax=Chitinophaga TaxID=79328 RepID=UPI0018E01B5A|nr:PAS domain-containing protein [Chitinophaga pendula]